MNTNKIQILFWLIIFYIILKFLPFWNYILYPINLIVTFLHEFWHAFFAFVTGWTIESIKINSDGSWLAYTSWWVRWIVLMWGYIGSAVFWNLILHYSLKSDNIAEKIMYTLAWFMIFSSLFFFASIVSSLILIIIWASLIIITKKLHYDSVIASFIWIASILHIIEDFNVGPSSDLAKFSEIFIIIPQVVWMYIWLLLVVWIFLFNLKLIFKK